MVRRYLPIAVLVAALVSSAAFWRWSEPVDEKAQRRIVRVAISRSGHWIAAGAASGWIGIFEVLRPDTPQRFRGDGGILKDLRFTQDEKWVTLENDSWTRHPVESLGPLEVVEPGEDRGEPQIEPTGSSATDFPERTSNLAEGPEGIVVFGNYAGSIEIHNGATGALIFRYTFR